MFSSREMSQFIQNFLPAPEAQGLSETSRSVRGAVGSDRKIEEGVRRVQSLLDEGWRHAFEASDLEQMLQAVGSAAADSRKYKEIYLDVFRQRNESANLVQRARQGIARIRHWIAGTDPARRSRRLREAVLDLDL